MENTTWVHDFPGLGGPRHCWQPEGPRWDPKGPLATRPPSPGIVANPHSSPEELFKLRVEMSPLSPGPLGAAGHANNRPFDPDPEVADTSSAESDILCQSRVGYAYSPTKTNNKQNKQNINCGQKQSTNNNNKNYPPPIIHPNYDECKTRPKTNNKQMRNSNNGRPINTK
jgi:hypothetical protein